MAQGVDDGRKFRALGGEGGRVAQHREGGVGDGSRVAEPRDELRHDVAALGVQQVHQPVGARLDDVPAERVPQEAAGPVYHHHRHAVRRRVQRRRAADADGEIGRRHHAVEAVELDRHAIADGFAHVGVGRGDGRRREANVGQFRADAVEHAHQRRQVALGRLEPAAEVDDHVQPVARLANGGVGQVVEQRVADEGGVHAAVAQPLLLKGQDAREAVDEPGHLDRPPLAAGPGLGRNVVHRAAAEPLGELQHVLVQRPRVAANHELRRAALAPAALELAEHRPHLARAAEGGEAEGGLGHGVEEDVCTRVAQVLPAGGLDGKIGPLLQQFAHEPAGVHVAAGLGRADEDVGGHS